MFVGVTLLSYLSVPQTFWQSGDPLTYTGTTAALLGPVFALTRVTEWWVRPLQAIQRPLPSKGAAAMSQKQPRKPIPKRDIILRVWVYGISLLIGLLGFILGWWGKIATGG